MKNLVIITVAGLLSTNGSAQAEDSSEYVSATFQEILSRVTQRDSTTGAIMRVKSKPDSPREGHDLAFSIKQDRNPEEVVILLSWNNKVDDGIHERYRLRLDEAMKVELLKQDRYRAKVATIAKKWREQQAKKITELSKGTLKYRMSQTAVEAVKGKPIKTEHPMVAAAFSNAIIWHYDDLKLHFAGGALQDVEVVE